MAERHRLKNGVPAHELTNDERRRGGVTRQEQLRQVRSQAREQANERFNGLLDKALDRLEDELKREEPDFRAIREVLDRTMGKATQLHDVVPDGGLADVFDAIRREAAEKHGKL